MVIIIFSIGWTQEETLVGKNADNGGYGGLVWKLTSIKGNSASIAGARGGWIINHTFAIGGGGYSTISDIKAEVLNEDNEPLYIILDYGGLELEYIHNSNRLIHWTFHTLLGGGGVRLIEHDSDHEIESNNLFVIEPSLDIDLNIINWFRLGMGVSYRLVAGLDSDIVDNSDVSGVNGLLVLKFGKF
jgi:hypothetical protein